MADSNNDFEPQVLPVTPLPILNSSTQNQTTATTPSTTQEVSSFSASPATIPAPHIPVIPISIEVIGTSLDTQQRLIKGSFSFGEVGAIKIGTYEFGVSGEIDISPNGITATNVNGTTTFSLDGTTGNATFLGTLQAGTLIAGDSSVIIGVGSSGGGRILLTNSGVPSILIGDPS